MKQVQLVFDRKDEARADIVRASLEGAGIAVAEDAAGPVVLLWSRHARAGLNLGSARAAAHARRLFLAPLDATPPPSWRGLKRLDPRGVSRAHRGRWGWAHLGVGSETAAPLPPEAPPAPPSAPTPGAKTAFSAGSAGLMLFLVVLVIAALAAVSWPR
jgi:hypothetical protein